MGGLHRFLFGTPRLLLAQPFIIYIVIEALALNLFFLVFYWRFVMKQGHIFEFGVQVIHLSCFVENIDFVISRYRFFVYFSPIKGSIIPCN